jgi:hypothetical protein
VRPTGSTQAAARLTRGPAGGWVPGSRPRSAVEERKNRPQESPAWQPFYGQDPFVSLIGSGEDDAADVSQKKYDYLAGTYHP